jgi:hypothetical protein
VTAHGLLVPSAGGVGVRSAPVTRDEEEAHMTAHDTFSAAPAGLRELLALASDLALQAGRIHAEGRRQVLTIETKSSPTDVVSQVDKEAERLIVDRLRAERPDDGLLAEEGSLLEGTSGVRWVVDPLDGTTNYVYGYPAYAASIAVEAPLGSGLDFNWSIRWNKAVPRQQGLVAEVGDFASAWRNKSAAFPKRSPSHS